jgi:hypothetical protein
MFVVVYIYSEYLYLEKECSIINNAITPFVYIELSRFIVNLWREVVSNVPEFPDLILNHDGHSRRHGERDGGAERRRLGE